MLRPGIAAGKGGEVIITMSRQIATHGEFVGQLVAERLGLRYLDQELLEDLARRLQVDAGVVSKFDEQAMDPVQSVLWEWLSQVNEQKYLRALRESLAEIADSGGGVVMGRGANFLHAGPQNLRVRLVAPLEYRIEQFCAMHDIAPEIAHYAILQNDQIREKFIRKMFQKDMNDSIHYDLSINLAETPLETAAAAVIHAATQRHAEPPRATAKLPPTPLQVLTRQRSHTPIVVEHENRKIA